MLNNNIDKFIEKYKNSVDILLKCLIIWCFFFIINKCLVKVCRCFCFFCCLVVVDMLVWWFLYFG